MELKDLRLGISKVMGTYIMTTDEVAEMLDKVKEYISKGHDGKEACTYLSQRLKELDNRME